MRAPPRFPCPLAVQSAISVPVVNKEWEGEVMPF